MARYLSLSTVKKWEPEARRRGVSKVARSSRGFLTAYKKAGSAKALPAAWKRKRNAFVKRHMAQVKAKGESLFEPSGRPTRRHLALIMWAYSPVASKLKAKLNPAPVRIDKPELKRIASKLAKRYLAFKNRGEDRFVYPMQTFKSIGGDVRLATEVFIGYDNELTAGATVHIEASRSHRRGQLPDVYWLEIKLNGPWEDAPQALEDELYRTLLHEATHIARLRFFRLKQYASAPGEQGNFGQWFDYVNDPEEIEARAQEIAEQVVESAKQWKRRRYVATLDHLLKTSSTWNRIETTLTDKNDRLIRQKVARALADAGVNVATGKGLVRKFQSKYPRLNTMAILLVRELALPVVSRSARAFQDEFVGRNFEWLDMPDVWMQQRERVLSAYEAKGAFGKLWTKDGKPTRRHFELMMWGYSPDEDGRLNDYLHEITTPEETVVKDNPPWADRILVRNWDMIKAKAKRAKLPTPIREGDSKKFEEFGCGHYGCVYPTKNENVVFKLTSDPSEVKFVQAAKKIGDWPDGIVRYFETLNVNGSFRKRNVTAIWREGAFQVGMPWIFGRGQTVDEQMLIEAGGMLTAFKGMAQIVRDRAAKKPEEVRGINLGESPEFDGWHYHKMQKQAKSRRGIDRVRFAIHACKYIAESMVNEQVTYYIGEAFLFYMAHGILLADVHRENVGQVKREENYWEPIWVITDPGHAVAIPPVWSYMMTETPAKSALPNPTYLQRLVKEYGTTDDPMLGGFLLPDGSFLDFSEGSGQRIQDHCNITWASLTKEKPHESRYDVMARIAKKVGMYRWMPENWSIEAWTAPTPEQEKRIEALAYDAPQGVMEIEAYDKRRHMFKEYKPYEGQDARVDLRWFYRGRDVNPVTKGSGRAWAKRVYEEKLASGDLPNLGSGFPKEVRAARAVQGIAERKLYIKAKRSHLKRPNVLSKGDALFWRNVIQWALEQEALLSSPKEWKAVVDRINKMASVDSELDADQIDFIQMKHPNVDVQVVLSRLVGEGLLSNERGVYKLSTKANPTTPEPAFLAMVRVRKFKPSLTTDQGKQVVKMYFEDLGWRPDRYGNLLHPTKKDERIHFSKQRVQKQVKIQGTWKNIRTWSPADAARQLVIKAATEVGDEAMAQAWEKGKAKKAAAKKTAAKRRSKQALVKEASILAMKRLAAAHPRAVAMAGVGVLLDKDELAKIVKERDKYVEQYTAALEQGNAPDDAAFASVDKPPTAMLGFAVEYTWTETVDGVEYTVHVEHARKGEANVTIGTATEMGMVVDPRYHIVKAAKYKAKGDAQISGRVFFNGETFLGSLFMISSKAKRGGAGSRVLSLWCRMMAGYGIEAWRAEAVGEEGAAFLQALQARGAIEILGGKGSDLVVSCQCPEESQGHPKSNPVGVTKTMPNRFYGERIGLVSFSRSKHIYIEAFTRFTIKAGNQKNHAIVDELLPSEILEFRLLPTPHSRSIYAQALVAKTTKRFNIHEFPESGKWADDNSMKPGNWTNNIYWLRHDLEKPNENKRLRQLVEEQGGEKHWVDAKLVFELLQAELPTPATIECEDIAKKLKSKVKPKGRQWKAFAQCYEGSPSVGVWNTEQVFDEFDMFGVRVTKTPNGLIVGDIVTDTERGAQESVLQLFGEWVKARDALIRLRNEIREKRGTPDFESYKVNVFIPKRKRLEAIIRKLDASKLRRYNPVVPAKQKKGVLDNPVRDPNADRDDGVFYIPASRMGELEKRIKRFERKSAKLRLKDPIRVEIVGDHYEPETNDFGDPTGRHKHFKVIKFSGKAPTVAGYTFVARVQHTPAGNIVDKAPGAEDVKLPKTIWKAPPTCQHCKLERQRKETFVLRKDTTGKLIRVGRSCLADFLRTEDAAAAVQLWSLIDSVRKLSEEPDEGEGGGGGAFVQDMMDWLSRVVRVIETYGWVSAGKAYEQNVPSTASEASWSTFPLRGKVTPEIRKTYEAYQPTKQSDEVAQKAIEWAKKIKPKSDYERNIQVIANLDYVPPKSGALAASLIAAYMRAKEKEVEAKKARERAAQKVNEWFGQPGHQYFRKLTLLRRIDIDGQWGMTYLHIFEDDEGRSFKWFASSRPVHPKYDEYHNAGVLRLTELRDALEADGRDTQFVEPGDTLLYSFTVKKHDDWDNRKTGILEKNTIITRATPHLEIPKKAKWVDPNTGEIFKTKKAMLAAQAPKANPVRRPKRSSQVHFIPDPATGEVMYVVYGNIEMR